MLRHFEQALSEGQTNKQTDRQTNKERERERQRERERERERDTPVLFFASREAFEGGETRPPGLGEAVALYPASVQMKAIS